MNVMDLERRLWEIAEDVRSREKNSEKAVAVGILTADDRDVWAKVRRILFHLLFKRVLIERTYAQNREHLLSVSPVNRATLSTIETSLFTLSLDAHTLPPRHPSDSTYAPLVRPEVDAHVSNCASGGPSGLNRWYDKSLTVAVESNGRAGMMGEHSPCDALIPSIIVDYAIAEPIDPTAFELTAGASEGDAIAAGDKWKRLEWAVDATLLTEIEAAKERAVRLVADSDPSQLWFDEYGAEWMKTAGKSRSPAFLF